MRVGLDLLGLPRISQGGTGSYAKELAVGLSRRADISLTVLAEAHVAEELASLAALGTEVVAADPRRAGRLVRAGRLATSLGDPRRYADVAAIPSRDLFAAADVVHYPTSAMSAPMHSRPTAVTALDLQHLEMPWNFSRADRVLRAARWHRSFRRADRLLAISEATKRSVIARLGIPAERIDVTYLDGDTPLTAAEAGQPAPMAAPFLFYPASPLPAKNHRLLIDAFDLVATADPDIRLALSGPELHDWSAVEARRAASPHADRILLVGHLDPAGLRAHYEHARGMVFPSLFEGFGIPLLEAMQVGCPVAASDAWSIPEVTGTAARLFDPRDVGSMASAMRWLVGLSGAERDAVVTGGRHRAAAFSHDRLIAETVAAYERAAGSGPP